MLTMIQPFVTLLAIFGFQVLAARQIGLSLARYKLPLISGYLLAGVVIGPFVLDLVSAEAVQSLTFIDDIALAFIAFSAGSELYLKEIRPRLVGISFITLGITLVAGAVSIFAFLLLADYIPFMQNLDATAQLAIAIASVAVVISLSRRHCRHQRATRQGAAHQNGDWGDGRCRCRRDYRLCNLRLHCGNDAIGRGV